MDAILLCAGRGKRLKPLTDNKPKALLEVGGQTLLSRHLKALREVGILRVILVVGYKADEVRRQIGDGSGFGLQVEYALQSIPRGTGDALRWAARLIPSDPFLLGYADIFSLRPDLYLRMMVDSETPKILCVPVKDAAAFGRLETMTVEGRRVLRAIVEKDGRHVPGDINGGWYVLPRVVLSHLENLPPSVRGEWELTDAVMWLITRGLAPTVVPTGDWVDVGTLESLQEANRRAQDARL